MMYDIQQNTSGTDIIFLMVSSSDHVSPVTGISPTVTLRKNQGSFASPVGTVSEISKGWYKIAGTGLTTDTNTLGPLALNATGTGADPTDNIYNIVGYDPRDGTRLGLSQIPSTGTIITAGTGSNQLSVSAGQVLVQTGTSAGQIDATSGVIKANISQIDGSSINTSSAQLGVNIVNIGGSPTTGAAGYVGIDWSKVNSPGSTISLTGTTVGIVSTVNGLATGIISSNTFNIGSITGVSTGILEQIRQTHRRFFNKVYKDASNIYTYADDNTTVITTQSYTSSTTETVNSAS